MKRRGRPAIVEGTTTSQATTRLPLPDHDRLLQLARRRGVTVSRLMRDALVDFVNKNCAQEDVGRTLTTNGTSRSGGFSRTAERSPITQPARLQSKAHVKRSSAQPVGGDGAVSRTPFVVSGVAQLENERS